MKFDTKFCENRLRPSNFRRIWIFYFFIMISHFKNSMYLRSSSKKESCEIGEEAIWEYRFTCFLLFFNVTSNFKSSMYPWSYICKEAKIKQVRLTWNRWGSNMGISIHMLFAFALEKPNVERTIFQNPEY